MSEESRKIINGDMETIQRAWEGLVQIGNNVPCPRVIIETCKNHGVGEYLTQEAWKQEYNFKKYLGYLIMLQRFKDELCIDIQVMCAKLQIDIGRVIRGMQYDLDVDKGRIMWMFERMAKEISDGKTAFDLAAEAGVGPKMLIRSFSTKRGGLSKDEMGRALAVRQLIEKRYKQSQNYSGQRLDGLGTRIRRQSRKMA